MKTRTDFVTNSSSTNYIFIGKSFEDILEYIGKHRIFDYATKDILSYIEEKGVDVLEHVFHDELELERFLRIEQENFAKMVEIDKKSGYVNTGYSGDSDDYIKILKKEITVDTVGKVGFIIEVGDNHGQFIFDEVEIDADYTLRALRKVNDDVEAFWESQH